VALLGRANDVCRSLGSTLIIAYAPIKAHVLLPLVKDRLPADKMRAFAALLSKDLPEAEELLHELDNYVEVFESLVRHWCEGESLAFLAPQRLSAGQRPRVTRSTSPTTTFGRRWAMTV